MDAGGLAQMSHPNFNPANSLAMPASGLASRRGGQNIKPLSFDALKAPSADKENGAPTPRTSRSHLLAGLRTAPKSATAATFPNKPASPTASAGPQTRNRNSMTPATFDNLYSGPKTSMPRYGTSQQQQPYNQSMGFGQQYTVDQILAPPQLQMEEPAVEQVDPNVQAQLMMANAYLSEQQQRLQQQLRSLQAAAQQFQGLSLNGTAQAQAQAQLMQQSYANLFQQQVQQEQQVQAMQSMMGQPIYALYDPVTGQQTLYVDQSQQAQLNNQFANQAQFGGYQNFQQQQQKQQNPNMGTPVVQVSPPAENAQPFFTRNPSPPRRYDSPKIENPAPLPPPSANAFRRGHKKSGSLANSNRTSLSIATEESPKSAGPKTASFPLTPLTAGYGPGQQRAGEHPVRQPRNPPSMDELKAKPTSKHEGSKNFVTRTRRSAIHNLVRAGLERRKEARSTGSVSPISESTEEMVETPVTDNDSDSGRSGSGSLVGDHDDAECSLPSSRTSTGSWGAIGSDRPSSRQKGNRGSMDSTHTSDNESSGTRDSGSFASLLKDKSLGPREPANGQRKAPMLVLTSAEKRKAD